MSANPRKRPPPTANGDASTAAGGTTTTAIPGIDILLAKYAKNLPPGGTVTVTLIKGPSPSSIDPLAAQRAAKAAADANNANDGEDGNGGGAIGNSNKLGKKYAGSLPLQFPRIAKFPETVSKPDFIRGILREGRMYEEDVPKAKDESDEEDATAYRNPNADPSGEGNDPNNPTCASSTVNKKRKKRWRKHDVRPRRWVIQDKAEFLERFRRRQRNRNSGAMGTAEMEDATEGGKLSNQYHGVVESNASKYVVLSVAPPPSSPSSSTTVRNTPFSKNATEQITIQPVYGFHTFSQPYKFASLTMEQAEDAIEHQRNTVTRYMMHGKMDKSEAAAALASGVAVAGRGNRPMGPPPKAMSRARLLGKLAGRGGGNDKDADDDDVMADVKFSTSRGSSRARRELLSSMADEGITVDDDGVLGGANDTEFGGRRRFGRVTVDKGDDGDDGSGKKNGKGEAKGGGTATGFEAGAMEEGFFQRDVSAEYEALDYDANEQFDDDDVNVGEDEMNDDGGGFGGDFNDDSDDEMFDSDDEEGSGDDLFKGMASSSGLKAMLAKARGDLPAKPEDGAAANAGGIAGSEQAKKTDAPEGEISKVTNAPKKSAEELVKKKAREAEAAAKESKVMGVKKGADGKLVINMNAIQREIWLNGGSIKVKRLMKKFDANNKHPERQATFKTIVMELCTFVKDADGNKFVLKQHYAKSNL